MAKYTNYVWEFNVKVGETPQRVGVKAVAIDDSLIATTIDETATGKLTTDGAVKTFVNNLITTTISADSTNTQVPSAQAVYEKIKDLGSVKIAGPYNLLDDITDPKENTIYLVKKASAKTKNAYDEYIYSNREFELLGEFAVSLDGYVKDTDYATAAKGGVIKSSTEDGAIAVDASTGKATLNGYNDLVKSSALADYYKMSDNEKDAGTGTLLSAVDKTKLDTIAQGATKTEITNTTTEKKITVTDAAGNETSLTIPEGATAAYDTIKVVGDTTVQASASNGTTVVFKQGDGIKLTTGGDADGNPTINIAVDTTDVIDVAEEIPNDTTKDSAIPNVGAVKAYVNSHEGAKPSYANGCIDLTV